MLYVFHGDSNSGSRKLLYQELEKIKKLGHDLVMLDGSRITPAELESALATTSLFSKEAIVIENLLSRLRSKDKDRCLELVSSYQGDKPVYLWDKKSLTKASLAKLGKNVKVFEAKTPTVLFKLLDALYPGNNREALSLLHQACEESEDIIVFTMIARQVSYLIMIKSASNPKFAPWQIGKLKSQASKWEESRLKKFMVELQKIDTKVKSGQTKLSYLDNLDLLLATLIR